MKYVNLMMLMTITAKNKEVEKSVNTEDAFHDV